jgi:hypothetical protein
VAWKRPGIALDKQKATLIRLRMIAVLNMARQRQKDAGNPPGFAIVIDTKYDDATPDDAYRVYYFSPVASEVCKSALEVLGAEESDEPTTNRGPVVGDLEK